MTCVASMMTPPQKKPAAGEPACVSYNATWKGKLEIEVAVPPTILARARGPGPGPDPGDRSPARADARARGPGPRADARSPARADALACDPEAGAPAAADASARAREIARSIRGGSFLPPTGRAAPAIDTAHTSTPMTGMNRD